MITLSIIKADTGGYVGHTAVHPAMMVAAGAAMREAVSSGLSSTARSPLRRRPVAHHDPPSWR
jgi:fructose 1,6-bisphosphatase